MIAYNYPDQDYTNNIDEPNYSDNHDYPKLIRVRAHTRWRLGKLEHVSAHWRYVHSY